MTWDQEQTTLLVIQAPSFARKARLTVVAFKMADHWVAEVFPPKFQFGSVDELLNGPQEDEKSKEKVKYLDEVYRRVYLQQEKARKSTDDELQVDALERKQKSQICCAS